MNPEKNPVSPSELPQAAIESPAQKPGKLDWLKSLFGKNKSTTPKQDGPIPGVTPATAEELNSSGPRPQNKLISSTLK